jgi:NADH-ubiquinone oxidoreductase chain 6
VLSAELNLLIIIKQMELITSIFTMGPAGILIFNSILSAIFVIIAKNPVISVIFLISLFLNAALFLIVEGMSYIGVSYILIYLGAIVVLFLFVIMMINVRISEILEIGSQYTKNVPLALIVSILFIYEFITVLPTILAYKGLIFNTTEAGINTGALASRFWPEILIQSYSHITSVAYSLYTFGAFWFLLTGYILLLAMIAPIYLSKRK